MRSRSVMTDYARKTADALADSEVAPTSRDGTAQRSTQFLPAIADFPALVGLLAELDLTVAEGPRLRHHVTRTESVGVRRTGLLGQAPRVPSRSRCNIATEGFSWTTARSCGG